MSSMEQENEYKTVYFVTTPFANSEEEIATSFIAHENEASGGEQVILLNEDCSIVINEGTSFVDEEGNSYIMKEGNSFIMTEGNAAVENEEITVVIQEDECRNVDDLTMNNEESSLNQPKDSLCVQHEESISELENSLIKEQDESSIMEHEESSIMEHEESSVIEHEESSVMEHDGSSFVEHDGSSIVEHDGSSIVEHDISSIVEHDKSSGVERAEYSLIGQERRSILKHKGNSVDCHNAVDATNPEEKEAVLSIVENEVISMVPEGVEVDKLTCRYCLKTFTKAGNKMRHIRQVHKIKKTNLSHIKCIECNTNYKHVQRLRDHLAVTHNLNMTEQDLCFPNMDAFKKWKHDIERRELTSFTLRHGARKTVTGQKYFYVCHRSGKYETRVHGPRQRMLKTPGTCKLGIVCTAAIYCEECPNEVVVRYCPHHYGHGKETSFVQLSTEEQTAIQENISKGIPFENLLDEIRDSATKDYFQLFLLKKKDIKFINKAFGMEEYNPGLSDAESVDRWVRQCCQMEDSPVLYYRQEEFANAEEEFMLIIMTEFQKHMLVSSEKHVVCVDSLYRRKGGRFYLTCLFIMDECEIAYPVAFCISNKVDKNVITQFLTSIRESTGPLTCTYFMSDSEKFYYESWVEVMNNECTWLWSLWYVDNRIRVQLRIFKGDVVKRAEAYKTMRLLLECQNQNVFETMFKNYIESLVSDPQSKSLGNFILQKYGSNKELWAYCYRKEIKLGTIIHLEVLHRTLRYCCREGRKKRLDKFIFVLMKLVRFKMLDRLASMLDDEKISLVIDAITMCHNLGLEIPTDHISSLSDKIWLIRSEDEEENVYVVREFDSCPEHCTLRCAECDICVHMFSCSCVHSMINANLCQHIHAVVWKFLTPHFSPPASPVHDDYEEIENIDVSDIPNNCSELLESVLKRTHDVYRKVRSNKCNLNRDSLTAVMKRLNECIDICSGKDISDKEANTSPPNAVYVINPYLKKDNSQPFLLPNQLPTILPQNKPLSQYVLVLPNNSSAQR